MLRHKTSLNKFKNIEIISSIFSDHKGLKLETNLKEKTQKHSNSRKLNNILLNNEWVKNQIKKKSKSFWKQMKMNTQHSQTKGHSKGSPERDVHSNTGLLKKDRNISNKQPNPTPTRTEGTTTKTAKSKYKKGNNQDQSRIQHRD